MPTKLTLIVAAAKNRVIGRRGDLPWRLSSDLKQFKAATIGKPIIMGRKTWESFPKRPLPARPNIILTRDHRFAAPGAWIYTDLDASLAAAEAMTARLKTNEVCVIGGAEIFAAFMPLATHIRLTEVNAEPEGDTYLAPINADIWRETAREDFAPGPKDDYAFSVRWLARNKNEQEAAVQ